jgi:hypothetical protein
LVVHDQPRQRTPGGRQRGSVAAILPEHNMKQHVVVKRVAAMTVLVPITGVQVHLDIAKLGLSSPNAMTARRKSGPASRFHQPGDTTRTDRPSDVRSASRFRRWSNQMACASRSWTGTGA